MSDQLDQETADRLRKYIESIEGYEDQKKEITNSIKEIYDEAKSIGFDPKIMKQIIKLRKQDQDKLEEEEFLIDTYKKAIGME
jgi:uncharacterized protein (UPF0335 family)